MEQKDTLYHMVYEHLKHDILQSKYKTGEKLPSLKELCEYYQVGRNTMRYAIHLLEEIGFVMPAQGSNHIVIYNIDDFEYNRAYRLMIISKCQTAHEVLRILGLIMPLIAQEALSKSSSQDQNKMLEIIEHIEKDKNANPNILLEQLMKLYTLAFTNLNNAMFLNLFQTMMSFITIPINTSDSNRFTSRYIQKKIRVAAMHNFKKALNGKTLVLKKIIPIFTTMVDKGGDRFCKEHCSDLKEFDPIGFEWRAELQQRYLYNQVSVDILHNMTATDLKIGDKLPSIEELGKTYGVSKNTIMKSIEELRLYGIVQSVNGIGTILVYDKNTNLQEILQKPHVQNNLAIFHEMLELSKWILASFQKKQFKRISQDVCEKILFDLEESFSIQPILNMICESYNPTLSYIFKQMSDSFVWQVFTMLLKQQDSYGVPSEETKSEIKLALRNMNMETVQKLIIQILDHYERILSEEVL
ncbi:GntR family transcriptional regulator [Amedibacillus sp. YH-ame10]